MAHQKNTIHRNDDFSTLKVAIPPNLGPDRRMLVRTPDGRNISAVVPEGCSAGSTILVRIAPPESSDPQQRQQQPPPSSIQQRVQTIRVPEGKRKKGEQFNVRLPDGRTILGTVPFDGCREFSLNIGTQSKQQRQQNWHDNPLAVAPMVFGPFL